MSHEENGEEFEVSGKQCRGDKENWEASYGQNRKRWRTMPILTFPLIPTAAHFTFLLLMEKNSCWRPGKASE